MGATNHTANYNLSQFVGTDKPAWLQDYNGDMTKIDAGINAAKLAADSAALDAGAAQSDATAANSAITNTIVPAITSLQNTVGSQAGTLNTITSLIGNGTPTTTDQTIIGAINEINAEVTGSYSFGSPVDITATDSSNPYVAPADGIIYLSGGNVGNIIRVNIDGLRLCNPEGVSSYAGEAMYPIKKGQSAYTVSLLPTASNQTAAFYPYVLQ